MAGYAEDCRKLSIPYLYDPSQQVTRLSGEEMREGFRGAAILIVNDYESGILTNKTGLDGDALAENVPVLIVTHGPDGSTIHARDEQDRHVQYEVPAAKPESEAVDPTGSETCTGRACCAVCGSARPAGGRPDRVRRGGVRPGDAGAPAPRFSPEAFMSRYAATSARRQSDERMFV
jgi:adenosine kinase